MSNSPAKDNPLKRMLLDRHGRSIALIGGGTLLSLLLAIVVFNIDPADPELDSRRGPAIDPEIYELDVPPPLTAGERLNANSGDQDIYAHRGWIESTDPKTGRLAQRHRFEELDPNPDGLPDGWLRIQQPEAEMHLENGRVIRISGASAVVFRPNRELEHGNIEGGVAIALFEPKGKRPPDLANDEPILTINTEQTTFDQRHGEIRCDGRVMIESPYATIPAHGLDIQIDDTQHLFTLTLDHIDYALLRSIPASQEQEAEPDDTHTAGAGTRGSQNEPKTTPSQDATFYVLTMSDNVAIRQHTREGMRTAYGDELSLVFSGESQQMAGGGMASVDGPAVASSVGLQPSSVSIAGLPTVIARWVVSNPDQGVPQPAVGEMVITSDGPLTVTPLDDPSMEPETPDDSIIALVGRPVVIDDQSSSTTASCRRVRYNTLSRTVEMVGDSQFPIDIDSPRIRARGERFWLSEMSGIGGFDGGGQLALSDAGDVQISLPQTPAVREGPPPDAQAPAQPIDPLTELHISWTLGVDLIMDESPQGEDRLKHATFNGDVKVRHEQLHLDAPELVVGFDTEADNQFVNSIKAAGGVLVRSVGDSGAMACQTLEVKLAAAADGSAFPTWMQATDDVRAEDDDRVIWSDTLEVTFEQGNNLSDEVAKVNTATAQGNVQVALNDGSRAFGDTLVADAINERAVLSGRNVVVARERMLFDHGTNIQLVIDQASGAAHWQGPGQLRSFREPILTPTAKPLRRIPRPAIADEDHAPQVKARWDRSMKYEDHINRGAGAVDLEGNVDAFAGGSPTEQNTMKGETLRLEFAWPPEPDPAAALDSKTSRKRTVRKLIATGDARLKNESWPTPARVEESRVFYVRGQRVEFDNHTGEAHVLGTGREDGSELLIHDPLLDPSAPSRQQAAPFGGRGTSVFQFSNSLHLRRLVGDQFSVVLAGNVVAIHRAQDGRAATFTGNRLEIDLLAKDAGNPPRTGMARTGMARTGIDFGGDMDLKEVRAFDRVLAKTPSYEVECDKLTYNPSSGIATAAANHGRQVTVIGSNGRLFPKNEAVEWDMINDVIRVYGARGGGGR